VLPNCQQQIRARMAMWVSLVALVGILSACARERPRDPEGIASLRLTCSPVPRGVRCRLVALFREVSRSPQDVTELASWQLIGGAARARMSTGGVIEATHDGNVEVDARYLSQSARAVVRLAPDRSGQILATLRGLVYVEVGRVLRPVPRVRVEILSGPSIGTWTTTERDGSYQLLGVAPGELMIRATKVGYIAADQSAEIEPGDNRRSLLIDAVPPTAASAL
jgi:hypothetical protein